MAEVVAGGGIYGRALKIADEWPEPGSTAGGGLRQQAPEVLKSHLAGIPTSPGLAARFSRSGVLWIPPVSFSADPRVVRQGLERFSEIDIPDCIAANLRTVSQLLLACEEVWMTGPERIASFAFGEIRSPPAVPVPNFSRTNTPPSETTSRRPSRRPISPTAWKPSSPFPERCEWIPYSSPGTVN
ncbi:hypothetical protein [Streptomyces sp. NPDC001601]|uniref:hypothetical protein n=1 Tax=Streptomyces sp. NPDC001601 TaxID=3364592 RepID=UPI00368B1985